MTNAFDLTCPSCHSSDVDVEMFVWVRLTSDGSDSDQAWITGHEFGDENHYRCASCEGRGLVKDLDDASEDDEEGSG